MPLCYLHTHLLLLSTHTHLAAKPKTLCLWKTQDHLLYSCVIRALPACGECRLPWQLGNAPNGMPACRIPPKPSLTGTLQ